MKVTIVKTTYGPEGMILRYRSEGVLGGLRVKGRR